MTVFCQKRRQSKSLNNALKFELKICSNSGSVEQGEKSRRCNNYLYRSLIALKKFTKFETNVINKQKDNTSKSTIKTALKLPFLHTNAANAEGSGGVIFPKF